MTPAAGPLLADAAVLFFEGALAGLIVTAPPGPVGALCIRRTVRDGFLPGLSTAVGALIADAMYAGLAALGLTQFATPAGTLRVALAGAAAVVLLVLGVRQLRSAGRPRSPEPRTAADAPSAAPRGRASPALVAGTFVLALGTPATLPAFLFVFESLDVPARAAHCVGGAAFVVAGVVVGSAAWWTALCSTAHRLRERSRSWVRGIDYACGLLLLVGAAGAAWRALVG